MFLTSSMGYFIRVCIAPQVLGHGRRNRDGRVRTGGSYRRCWDLRDAGWILPWESMAAERHRACNPSRRFCKENQVIINKGKQIGFEMKRRDEKEDCDLYTEAAEMFVMMFCVLHTDTASVTLTLERKRTEREALHDCPSEKQAQMSGTHSLSKRLVDYSETPHAFTVHNDVLMLMGNTGGLEQESSGDPEKDDEDSSIRGELLFFLFSFIC
ncbi:hypothetical protein IRJ41_007013 [Triplophysa rosa]|uniref:Uncharacterized protein n=1 Tax=Triplophysa rosa TaxID=992332 RepID=A0A9W7TIV3_TRIRA|nr:hypothetical protein IRJ41_007013 [Triplophysa rosa]